MKGQRATVQSGVEPGKWREVLARAREEFGGREGCLGVKYCEKRKGGNLTGQNAIVVYVRQKRHPKEVPRGELIPPEIEGCLTDVVEVFSKDRPRRHLDYIKDHHRSHDLAALDYTRIHKAHLGRVRVLPEVGRTGVVGEVFIIEDPNGRLTTEENGEAIPDLVEAYKVFRQFHEDIFDFVTFFTDVDSGMPTFDTSFNAGIYNNIRGIGLSKYDYRLELGGSKSLQSLHFIHHTHFNRYVILQEVGHRWGAFVGFRESAQGPVKYDLLIPSGAGAFSHWDILFDDDLSPMDYDQIDWVENPDGTFRNVTIPHQNRRYCNLDLYLMGLVPPTHVGSFYYLRNPQPVGGGRYAAEKKQLQAQNVIWAEEERVPAAAQAQKSFRQAFVLLTRHYDSATSLAETIDRFRHEYAADFTEATGNRATVDTTLELEDGRKVEGYVRQEYHRRLLIPDQIPGHLATSVESTLAFAETDPVKDIEVSLRITHTYVGDLRIVLVGPDGTQVTLRDQAGESARDIEESYTPEQLPALLNFLGKRAKGNWTLKLSDVWPDDEGHLETWSLKLTFGTDGERIAVNAQINKIMSEAQHHEPDRLYAGLTLLAMDTQKYLESHPRPDAKQFLEIVKPTMESEKKDWPDSPLFDPSKAGLPTGLAINADKGDFSPAVFEGDIVHEYTLYPGQRLMEKFGSKFKETICGKDGPYERLNKGLLGQADLPATIVSTILTTGFSPATFWVPLAVYITLLITKAGLKTYCEK